MRDLENNRAIRRYEWPKGYLEREIARLKPYYPNIHVKDVALDEIWLDDEGLGTYHVGTWGDNPKKYEFDEEKLKKGFDVPYAHVLADGTLTLGDGRHRYKALKNAGYTHVPTLFLD